MFQEVQKKIRVRECGGGGLFEKQKGFVPGDVDEGWCSGPQQKTLFQDGLAVVLCHWVHGGMRAMQEYLRGNGFSLNRPLNKPNPAFGS